MPKPMVPFPMKHIASIAALLYTAFTLWSCGRFVEESSTDFEYYDVTASDTTAPSKLVAVTDEEFLQPGSSVAYLDKQGDTIIAFGKYRYYDTDTLAYFANVLDTTIMRAVGIDRNQMRLFDLVWFDNAPDPFKEGLIRVSRNGKMGYANKYGRVVIPCIYDYATWFDNGVAEVTFDATEYADGDEHTRVESDEWIKIDKNGNRIE